MFGIRVQQLAVRNITMSGFYTGGSQEAKRSRAEQNRIAGAQLWTIFSTPMVLHAAYVRTKNCEPHVVVAVRIRVALPWRTLPAPKAVAGGTPVHL